MYTYGKKKCRTYFLKGITALESKFYRYLSLTKSLKRFKVNVNVKYTFKVGLETMIFRTAAQSGVLNTILNYVLLN
jgi:hypothetical protein